MNTGTRGENFPVTGWFVPRAVRPAVAAYYAFARSADNIADNPTLPESEKRDQLSAMGRDLAVGATGTIGGKLRDALTHHGIPLTVASDLLVAFSRDAEGIQISTQADLTDYCRYSAAPVGRFLLALHRQNDAESASDALCEALQVLNHVQDCRDDAVILNRCYVPALWLQDESTSMTRLIDGHDIDAGRRIAARMLDHAAQCLTKARHLDGRITHRGLGAQSAMILRLAGQLEMRLRRGNPWQGRMSLSPFDWLRAGCDGLIRYVSP